MKLIINKFPPITGRCEIDLSKKLTLFVGHNNSGKTYISQLIWGIYNIKATPLVAFNQTNKEPIPVQGKMDIALDDVYLDKLSKMFTKYLVENEIPKIFKKDIECDIEIKIEESDLKNMAIQYTYHNMKVDKALNSTTLTIKFGDVSFRNYESFIEIVIVQKILNKPQFLPSNRLFLPSFYKYIFNTEKAFKDSMYKNLDKIDENNKKFVTTHPPLPQKP